jgi:MAC/Perforin domain
MIGLSLSARWREVIMSELESVAGVSGATAHDLPNFGAMGQGVDVLLLDLQDPGFAQKGALFVYQDDAVTPDNQYRYPSQMTFTARWATTLSATASIMQSAFDMSQMIRTSMSVDGQSEKFAFSASAAYTYAATTTAKFTTVITEAAAVATLWELTLIPNQSHPFAKHFHDDVGNLSPSGDPSAYQTFIKTYGTHYFTSASFGGRSYQRFTATTANMATLVSQGISVSAQASLGLELSFKQGTKQKDYEEFLEKVSVGQLRWLGGRASTDWNTWVASVQGKPMVVASSLSPIYELFTPANFSQVAVADLAQIKAQMQQAVESYLQQRGVDPVDGQLSYGPIQTDPPLPVTVGFSPLLTPGRRLAAKPTKGEGHDTYAVTIDSTPPAVIGLEPIDPSGNQSTVPCPSGAPVALAPAVQPMQETVELWVLQQWGSGQVNLGAYEPAEVPAPAAATWQILSPFGVPPTGGPLFDGAVVQIQNHQSEDLVSANGNQPGISSDAFSPSTYWVLHVTPAQ